MGSVPPVRDCLFGKPEGGTDRPRPVTTHFVVGRGVLGCTPRPARGVRYLSVLVVASAGAGCALWRPRGSEAYLGAEEIGRRIMQARLPIADGGYNTWQAGSYIRFARRASGLQLSVDVCVLCSGTKYCWSLLARAALRQPAAQCSERWQVAGRENGPCGRIIPSHGMRRESSIKAPFDWRARAPLAPPPRDAGGGCCRQIQFYFQATVCRTRAAPFVCAVAKTVLLLRCAHALSRVRQASATGSSLPESRIRDSEGGSRATAVQVICSYRQDRGIPCHLPTLGLFVALHRLVSGPRRERLRSAVGEVPAREIQRAGRSKTEA